MRDERWAVVPGFENYQVSDAGRVRRGKILKTQRDRKGYATVSLWKDGKRKVAHVSSLVCAAFIGARPDRCHAAHRNGKRDDDRLENLYYATPKENEADKHRHGTALYGDRHHQSKLTSSDVMAIRAIYTPYSRLFGKVGLSKKYGVGVRTIQDAIYGVTWSHLSGSRAALGEGE